ncbi:PREDICTED: golgin subfamily A member 6-like protein 22 [Cyphomyrmex costatus]|uniref:golgin subfamily A member 6-like protein 22 n=1 Tax=Cyphomyrmex costatus TaxID=456900 RepID=UPI0008522410|nr:PREDICTED: golgin subfamily A member 6-like protein 22 [Cyphomyrmex costatus]
MPEGWRQQPASRDCKKGRAKGGIITGVRTELEEKENVCKEEQGMQERVVSLDGETWRMVTVYNREGKKELLEKIKEEIKEEEEERLMIVGDFNARIGRKGGWEEGEEDGNERREERYSKDEVVNSQGKELIEVIEERGWIVLNGTKEGDEEGEWTYEKASGRSVIDYGIVNWEAWQRVKRFEVGCRVESDHQPIIFELENYVERREENKKEEGTVQDWSEEGIKEFKKRIEGAVWKEERVIKEWEELEGELNKAVKVRRKGKRREIGWCPWWDKECREKKIETNRARRRYRRKREQGDEEFIRCRKEYRDLCKKKEEVYRKKEKREVENIKTEAEAWKFINKGRKKREGICKEIEIGKWEKHFREIFGGVEEKRQLWQRNKEVHREKGEGIGQEERHNKLVAAVGSTQLTPGPESSDGSKQPANKVYQINRRRSDPRRQRRSQHTKKQKRAPDRAADDQDADSSVTREATYRKHDSAASSNEQPTTKRHAISSVNVSPINYIKSPM